MLQRPHLQLCSPVGPAEFGSTSPHSATPLAWVQGVCLPQGLEHPPAGGGDEQPAAGVAHEVADVEIALVRLRIQQVGAVQRAVLRVVHVRRVDAPVFRVPVLYIGGCYTYPCCMKLYSMSVRSG